MDSWVREREDVFLFIFHLSLVSLLLILAQRGSEPVFAEPFDLSQNLANATERATYSKTGPPITMVTHKPSSLGVPFKTVVGEAEGGGIVSYEVDTPQPVSTPLPSSKGNACGPPAR